VQPEVQTEVDNLVSINVDAGVTAAATATVTFVAGGADVAVDVTIDSENAFARAIGAGSQIPVDSTATAHVELQPADKLWPIGFYAPAFNGQSFSSSVQPYQCRNVDAGSGTATPRVCGGQGGFPDGGNGGRNRLLGMTGLGAFPVDCTVDNVSNFINGVDHVVDTRSLGVRTEANACAFGHFLTLPSAADPVTLPATSTVLDEAIIEAGGPLSSASDPLWRFLLPGGSGQCDPSLFTDTPATLEDDSNQMRLCLRSWNGSTQLFIPGVVNSPRFAWGIDIEENGLPPEEFEAPILLFLNTLVPDDASLMNDPLTAQYLDGPSFPASTADVGAVTMFSLATNMLSSADNGALDSPFFDIDMLDFTLIN
jgi:hypothetical protein